MAMKVAGGLALLGVALVLFGVYLVYPPAAAVAAGLVCLALAYAVVYLEVRR